MHKNRKSKKQIYFVVAISLFLFLCSVAFIIVNGLLQEKGYVDEWIYLIGILASFFCSVLAVVLLISIWRDALFLDIEKKNIEYEAKSLFTLKDSSEDTVRKAFVASNFQETEGGYLKRKIFSISKDAISYYIKSIHALQIHETIDEQFHLFEQINENSKNVCFILFVYKSNVTKDDFNLIKEISKYFIIEETAVPMQFCHTSIVVLVDSQTNEGYFLDIGKKMSISIYAHGCRLLKKHLYQPKQNEDF